MPADRSPREPVFRFVFDQHVNARALRELRERGVDAVHAAEVGLADADDAAIFNWALREGRIIVTRNYRDFAPLVTASGRRGQAFPGVLFYPTSIHGSDVGAHVRALERWIENARGQGGSTVRNSYEWLGSPP